MALENDPQGHRDPGSDQAAEGVRATAAEAQQRATQAVEERRHVVAQEIQGIGTAFRSAGEALREQGQSSAADFSHRAADSAERFGHTLSQKSLSELISDVDNIARRQPLLVAGAAALCGFAVTRFFRTSSSSGDEGWSEHEEESAGESGWSEPYPGATAYSTGASHASTEASSYSAEPSERSTSEPLSSSESSSGISGGLESPTDRR